MGMLADRTRTRWGKFRPSLLWFCMPLAAMGVLTFTVPNLGASGKLVWAYVTYNAIMLIYTAINIPYTALLGVITPNPNERTTLVSFQLGRRVVLIEEEAQGWPGDGAGTETGPALAGGTHGIQG